MLSWDPMTLQLSRRCPHVQCASREIDLVVSAMIAPGDAVRGLGGKVWRQPVAVQGHRGPEMAPP
jgi:hypothetical protein